jgi:hypothetical protein
MSSHSTLLFDKPENVNAHVLAASIRGKTENVDAGVLTASIRNPPKIKIK